MDKQKVFLDCGYHLGEGLVEFTSMLNIDDSWEVHSFEANSECEIFKKINQHPFHVNAHEKAVWIENGQTIFNKNDNDDSPKYLSTSKLDGHGSSIASLSSSHGFHQQELIETIDFSEFIEQFKNKEVYCKMDIEGAEFSILRKLLKTSNLNIIKELWVEWHGCDLPNETQKTQDDLENEIKKHTIFHNWK